MSYHWIPTGHLGSSVINACFMLLQYVTPRGAVVTVPSERLVIVLAENYDHS